MIHEIHDIDINNIDLDSHNPREGQLDLDQTNKLRLYAGQSKTLELAKHIAENGMNPSEFPILIVNPKNRKRYIVVEGNRRISAIKLLLKPALISKASDRKKYQIAASEASNLSSLRKVSCFIMENRDEADTWILVKHGGEQEGIGVVPWAAAERARYEEMRGRRHQDIVAMRLVQYARDRALIDDDTMINADSRITTISRVVKSPEFRDNVLGLIEGQDDLLSKAPKGQFDRAVVRVITDIANEIQTSRSLNNISERNKYIETVIKEERIDLNKSIQTPRKVYQVKFAHQRPIYTTSRSGRSRRTIIGDDYLPSVSNSRILDIIDELKSLNANRYPNACAVLVRVLVEMIVVNYAEVNNLRIKREDTLRVKLESVTSDMRTRGLIDSSEIKFLENLVNTTGSLFSITALHQYVHNPKFKPAPGDLKIYWDNIENFTLVALNNS